MARHRIGNYSFQWTDTHLPREETDPLRFDYDELGSKAVKKLQQMAREKSRGAAADASYCLGAFDMYAALRDHHAEDETLDQLWREAHTVPDWVDWTQIERGQKFFYRYAPANLMGFALQGFVGENSAASGVVEVLVRTGGFSTRVLLRRLLETLQLVLQVTESLESIQPGGRGHATALRVRLLHSAVRERILRLAEARPDYFDVGRFGVPVNTLDCIHSVATFCCNHMWLQLPRMGVYPSEQETADYIAVFRYVGYLLATPDTYFASVARAKATMESMLVHELRITETSRVVGHNFVECVRDLPPLNMSAGFIEAGSRALNGDELCDSLGLGRAGLLAHACWRGHCWFVRGLALAQRRIPGVDDVVVKYFRRALGEAVRKSLGGASKMEFRHVPRLGKLTKREANARITSSSSSSSSAAEASLLFLSWPLRRPVEAFYFAVFVFGCALMLGGAVAVVQMLGDMKHLVVVYGYVYGIWMVSRHY